MNRSFARAPHIEGVGAPVHPSSAPNAALLIDFDNVTMGMRSDLSRELKSLLNSDVIRGKVTVQRAYADWRRYPQYIVPLSEASIDLIFAPAYGSSKKNATDIRMAIDGIELVFTRPEIGTFILLTGDSDFSSLVLKLKEYGKYVIGVGIQESSSDILVQNCDEYYSYTALSGLRKTDEDGASATDPWVLVERAVEQMGKRSDVMRSDRLKQVMLEIDPNFDEKAIGFSKFSKFISEASSKGLLKLQKMENGQYEIVPGSGGGARRSEGDGRSDERRPGERSDGRRSGRGRGERSRSDAPARAVGAGAPGGASASTASTASPEAPADGGETEAGAAAPGRGRSEAEPSGPVRSRAELEPAYDLLVRAVGALADDHGSDSVRDSDVKRRMLALEPGFDEGALGFPKFSRFLRQAHDHEVVTLTKGDDGNYQVAVGKAGTGSADARGHGGSSGSAASTGSATSSGSAASSGSATSGEAAADAAREPLLPTSTGPGAQPSPTTSTDRGGFWSRLLRPRETARRPGGGAADGEPPIFEGQMVSSKSAQAASAYTPRQPSGPVLEPGSLHLPTGRESMIQYLTNSYAGVGERTAEALVTALGEDLFIVLQKDPARVAALLPPARAEKVLEGWDADFERRRARHGGTPLEGDDGALSSSSDASSALNPHRGRRTRGDE